MPADPSLHRLPCKTLDYQGFRRRGPPGVSGFASVAVVVVTIRRHSPKLHYSPPTIRFPPCARVGRLHAIRPGRSLPGLLTSSPLCRVTTSAPPRACRSCWTPRRASRPSKCAGATVRLVKDASHQRPGQAHPADQHLRTAARPALPGFTNGNRTNPRAFHPPPFPAWRPRGITLLWHEASQTGSELLPIRDVNRPIGIAPGDQLAVRTVVRLKGGAIVERQGFFDLRRVGQNPDRSGKFLSAQAYGNTIRCGRLHFLKVGKASYSQVSIEW